MDFRTKLEIYKNERERRPNSVGLLIEGDSWFDLPFIFQGTNLVMSLKEALGDKIAIQIGRAHV